jgi:hypothetical protein
MDEERSIVIGILLLVLLGASEMFIFGWIVVRQYGLATLYTSRAGQDIILMFLIFTGAIFYSIYLKITGQEVIEPLDERSKDPRERSFDINKSFQKTFDFCRLSIGSLPGGEIQSADEQKGIIDGWAYGLGPSTMATAVITITLQKISEGITHIHIRCITPIPTSQPIPRLIDHYFSRNERYVKRMHDFIQEQANQGDGILLDYKEDYPQDT